MEFPTDRLYKFSSFNENSLSALADQTVWFSDLDSLNDPFEVSVRYEVPEDKNDKIAQCIKVAAIARENKLNISSAKALAYVESLYEQDPVGFLNEFDKAIEFVKNEHTNLLNSLNIFSTSLDLDEKSFHSENMLMWSHYGIGFTGFCLQFSANEFLQSINKLNPESNIGFCKVEYVTETQIVNPIKYVPHPDESYFDTIKFKHNQWEYEGELRFISGNKGLHQYSSDALEKVFIGFKMPPNKQKVLIAILRQYFPSTHIYRTEIDKTSYCIVANKI